MSPVRDTPDDDGAVSGEFAAALPAVVLVLTLLLSLGMHAAAQVSLEAGARAAARELARGESPESAEATARRVTGAEIEVSTTTDGEFAQVELTRQVQLLGLLEITAEQSADAAARMEHRPAEQDTQP